MCFSAILISIPIDSSEFKKYLKHSFKVAIPTLESYTFLIHANNFCRDNA